MTIQPSRNVVLDTYRSQPELQRVKPVEILPDKSLELEYRGKIDTDSPSFLTWDPQKEVLYVSSFGLLGAGEVSGISGAGEPATAEVDHVASVDWPNEVSASPVRLDGRNALAVPSGFLVPGHQDGALLLAASNPGSNTWGVLPLTETRPGWFYHRAEWVDMNDDGRLDIVTARARKPILGPPGGELVWLEQPEGPLSEPWVEHKLADGPDVHFRVADLNQDGEKEFVAAEFFKRNLSLHFLDGSSRVIDSTLGSAFDVQVVDLDGDGRPELLVTNHESSGQGAVYAYKVPEDLKHGQFERHCLLGDIPTRPGFNSAAPGQALAFQPRPEQPALPWILVSGDGSQKAHLLEPLGAMQYREHVLMDAHCTVGQSAVADVDHDGYAEIMIPAWEKGQVHVFSFANSPSAT